MCLVKFQGNVTILIMYSITILCYLITVLYVTTCSTYVLVSSSSTIIFSSFMIFTLFLIDVNVNCRVPRATTNRVPASMAASPCLIFLNPNG